MKKCIVFILAMIFSGCNLNEAPKCVPGGEMCETESALHSSYYSVCNDAGVWDKRMACAVCDGNHCGQLDVAACHDGDSGKCQTFHDVSISFSCSYNNWIPEFCEGGCEDDHCQVVEQSCEENAVLCMDLSSVDASVEFTCMSGKWVSKYCSAGKACDGNRCGQEGCTENASQCVEEAGIGKIYTCLGGEWKLTYNCGMAACDGNQCNTGYTGCTADYKCEEFSGVGRLYECRAGSWILIEDCGNKGCNGVACDDDENETCVNGETKCVEESGIGKIYTCDGGAWKLTKDCETSACNGNVCGTCIDGTKSCIGVVSVECKDDSYEQVEVCTAPAFAQATCSNGTCGYECNEGYCKDGSSCVSKQASANHCGECGHKCGANQICYMGECVQDTCASGEKYVTRKVMTRLGEKTIKAYCINSLTDFKAMRAAINQSKPYPDDNNTDNAYVLTTDLTIEDTVWESIGNVENSFSGYFLGNNHTITVKNPLNVSNSYYGFFGVLRIVTITGLNLSITLMAEKDLEFVGGLIGGIESGYLSDIHVTVNIERNGKSVDYVGGITGSAFNTTITNCSVESPLISGRDHVGGIAGTFSSSGIMSNVYFNGILQGDEIVGGIAGSCQSSRIVDSKTEGKIAGSDAGGICGNVSNGYGGSGMECSDESFNHLYSGMDIVGAKSVGGIFGSAENICITNSSATGNLIINDVYGGGFVGNIKVGTVKNSYAMGSVTGDSGIRVGGFVGNAGYNVDFNSCGAFGSVSGQYLIGGFLGYTYPDSSYCAGGHPFENCFAMGDVLATSPTETEGSGGFVGGYKMTTRCYNAFVNCYSLGKVQQGGESLYSGNFIGTVISEKSGMKPVVLNSYAFKSLDKDFGVYETTDIIPEIGEIKVNDHKVVQGDSLFREQLGDDWKSYRCVMSEGVLAPYCIIPMMPDFIPEFCELQ